MFWFAALVFRVCVCGLLVLCVVAFVVCVCVSFVTSFFWCCFCCVFVVLVVCRFFLVVANLSLLLALFCCSRGMLELMSLSSGLVPL